MQLDIFDAIRERDEAMNAIEGVTDKAFTECATDAIKTVGRMRQQFTTDDVWDWLATHKSIAAHDNRAIGPIMSRLSKQNVITPTGNYQPSVRRHCAPIRVWRLV